MNILSAIISLIVLIYSAILHEIAHGYVAERFGDPTARLSGRLTLNPKSHIDPFMSIILPLLLLISGSPVIFGAAKPVPVDPFNFRDGRKDLALVSLAGPLTNVALAIAGTVLIKIISLPAINTPFSPLIVSLLYIIVQINLLLAIFNLIPIPPLDGSKIFALLLPEGIANVYLSIQSVGILILLLLLVFPIGGFSLSNIIFNLLNFSLKLLGL